MRIRNKVTIFTGDAQNGARAEKGSDRQPSSGKDSTFYAGSLLKEFPLKDRLQQKRAQAQARAMKIVEDTWNSDRKTERLIQESREHIGELRATYKEAKDRISEIEEESETLREVYGVDSDSEEQQHLNLLLKAQAAGWAIPGEQLTEEESRRLYEYDLQGKGLTEYQERQLKLNDEIGRHKLAAHIAEYGSIDSAGIRQENAVIRGIREEQRKVHPMADAQKQADEMMEAARDEAIGMIVEESREHIDQEQKEKEEEAEEIKEKKAEQEAILEKRKERGDELEEFMEDMPLGELEDLKNAQTEMQQEIQNLVSKMNLIAEDIKGTKVDTNI